MDPELTDDWRDMCGCERSRIGDTPTVPDLSEPPHTTTYGLETYPKTYPNVPQIPSNLDNRAAG